jgi:hypothetical protein
MNVRDIKFSVRYFIYTIPLLAACLLTEISFSQISQPHRYEKKQKGSDDYFTIIPAMDEGLVLLRSKDKYNGNKNIWELIYLDTALRETRSLEFEVSNKNNLAGYEYVKGELYLLYRIGDTNKNSLELIQFTMSGVEVARFEISPELDFKLTHFNKAGPNIVLGGYVSKEPVILIYELATKLIRVVPGFFQKENELVDLRINQNQTFNTVIIDRSAKSEKKIVFKTFDTHGKMLLDDIVAIDDIKSLQSCLTSTLERDELMVLGTWGDRQAKQSVGFFTLVIDPFHDQKINYINFSTLDHFMDYMKPARAKRIKESTEKDIQAGRNPDFANYVMPFRMEENKKGFFVLAEVYTQSGGTSQLNNPYVNPMYGTMSPYLYNLYMPYSSFYYPRMYRPYYYNGSQKSAFEFQTTEAVLLAIDADGKLLWDQSMEIEDVKRSALEQTSEFYYSGQDVVFFYKAPENELRIKTIDLDNTDVSTNTEKLRLLDPQDEFRSERNESGLKKWYGNAFYVWGYQTIRNLKNKEDRVRDVFYVNKIVVK